MGMLEETFAFGSRPRTFRYEQGCDVIAVREGGEYGQVGKTFTFEQNGIAETGWGRNGEIERVFIFEPGNETITERTGGWFGDVERTIMFKGINASLFREPEAFLQFLMFTEWSAGDREEVIQEQVAKIRGGAAPGADRSPYAFTGERHTSEETGLAGGRGPAPRSPAIRQDAQPARAASGRMADSGIDFIPEGGSPGEDLPRGPVPPSRRSSDISFDERRQPAHDSDRQFPAGRSVEIPLEERFGKARNEREPLTKGRSAEISVSERFESARGEREPLSKGRSVEIPLEERFESSRGEREKLAKGGSADISLDERFESAHAEREKLSKGKSTEIPYSERRAGRDR
jgi:hypothetical protein